jgi:hypothetical protein
MNSGEESGPHAGESLTTELLVLPDGRILVHNLTATFAELLRELNPDDPQIALRTGQPARGASMESE